MRPAHRVVPAWMVVATLLASILGCASATKRLEQGAELESQGRYAEAAARYVQALRKDPGLPEARAGLARAGVQAIEENRSNAARFRTMGSLVQAADLYCTSDALVQEAASVGVPLALAEGYAESRRTTLDEAIEDLLHTGRSAEANGQWAAALHAYEHVGMYDPKSRQKQNAHLGQVRTTVLWSEADLAAGHYRSAFQRAEAALALLGDAATHGDPRGGDLLGRGEPTWSERAADVREEAVTLGTVRAVLTPVRSGAGVELPEGFLAELNDELELQQWTQPPIFVAVTDPVVVRRELRRLGRGHGALGVRDAARIGRDLGASFVVGFVIDSLHVDEHDVVREKRSARTKGGVDTTYTVIKGRTNYAMTATVVLVDVAQGREFQRFTLDAAEPGHFTRAEYDGDPRYLRLADNERHLFDSRRTHEEEEETQDRLIASASRQLAARTYASLINCVP